MNANRMYSLAVAATLCCAPAFAQSGMPSTQAPPSGSAGTQQGAAGSANGGTGMNGANGMAGADNNGMMGAQGAGGPAMDKAFVKKAVVGNMMEVQMGQLALQKSSDDQVKQFAQRMVDDHGKMLDQMKPIAQQMGVQVPDTLPASKMKMMDKMKNMSGSSFDQAYIKDMVKDHKEDDQDFKKEAASTQNPQLKELVTQGDQTIESHLQMIQQIAQGKGGMSKNSM